MRTRVAVDNRASKEHTVIEVTTLDRPGVLFAISNALFELGLTIAVAKISTEGTRVADVFYVTERTGQKVDPVSRAAAIEGALRRPRRLRPRRRRRPCQSVIRMRAMITVRRLSFAVLSLSSSALLVACTPPPPPEDPLMADPPVAASATRRPPARRTPSSSRASCLLQAGKPAEALPHFKTALAADPKSAEAAFYLAVATEQTGGDLKEVEKLYKQAITFNPKLVDAALNLGAIYLAEPALPDEAIAMLDKALAHSPGDPKLHHPSGIQGQERAAGG